MDQDFSTAFLLFAVGMVTVFSILGLIVLTGQWLILFINRFFPETLKPVSIDTGTIQPEIDPKKLAAIVTAVDIVTKGRAKVTSVKKAD